MYIHIQEVQCAYKLKLGTSTNINYRLQRDTTLCSITINIINHSMMNQYVTHFSISIGVIVIIEIVIIRNNICAS